MSIVIANTVKGIVKVANIPERASFRTWDEFIRALPNFLTLELPASVSGIVVGNEEPATGDTDKLWLRRVPDGTVLGLYAFQAGNWERLHLAESNEIRWFFGTSLEPPKGWITIEEDDGVLDSATRAAIRALFVPNGSGAFSYYAARFVGY